MPQYTESGSQTTASKPAEEIDRYFDRTLQDLRIQREQGGGPVEADPVVRARKWAEMIAEAEKLHARLSGEPRVLYFGFNHDQQELSVKIAGNPGRAHTYFILCSHHPDTLEVPPLECVWLRQIGEPDKSYVEPKDALRDLTLRIAQLLV
jgi:hypothetical protein